MARTADVHSGGRSLDRDAFGPAFLGVAEGIEGASDAFAGAAGAAATAAAREGLNAGGVQDKLNQVAGSVRRVADRGLDAALGGTPEAEQSEQQPMTERNPT